jgi:hypothetical protein
MYMKKFLFVLALVSLSTASASFNHTASVHYVFKSEQKKEKIKEKKKKGNNDKTHGNTAPKDSLALLKKQVDSLFTLMTTKVVPFVDAQNGNQNAANAGEIEKLEKEIAVLTFSLSKARDSVMEQVKLKEASKRAFESKESQFAGVNESLKKQEAQLNADISSLTKLSYDVDDAFITSIEKRLETFPSADRLSFDQFKTKREALVRAKAALSKKYDANEVTAIIQAINSAFPKVDKFTALTKSKEELLSLLNGYCSKTALLRSFMVDAAKLNGFEAERVKKLKNGLFTYIEYDYLIKVILQSISDATKNDIENVVTSCE